MKGESNVKLVAEYPVANGATEVGAITSGAGVIIPFSTDMRPFWDCLKEWLP